MQILQSPPQNSVLLYAFTVYYQSPFHLLLLIMIKCNIILIILSVQFGGIRHRLLTVQPSPPSCSQCFHLPRLKLCPHQALTSPSLHPQVPWNHHSIFWVNLAILETFYKWNPEMFVLLWPPYFTCRKHSVLTLQPQHSICQNFPVFMAE